MSSTFSVTAGRHIDSACPIANSPLEMAIALLELEDQKPVFRQKCSDSIRDTQNRQPLDVPAHSALQCNPLVTSGNARKYAQMPFL